MVEDDVAGNADPLRAGKGQLVGRYDSRPVREIQRGRFGIDKDDGSPVTRSPHLTGEPKRDRSASYFEVPGPVRNGDDNP